MLAMVLVVGEPLHGILLACGACMDSMTSCKTQAEQYCHIEIKLGFYWWLQEIMDVEQIMDEDQGLQLTEENVEKVLDEIRPYLVGECFPCNTRPTSPAEPPGNATFCVVSSRAGEMED